MRCSTALAVLMLVALAALEGAARAAPGAGPSVSYSTWIVSRSERTVTLRYRLSRQTARALTGTRTRVLTVRKVGRYVLEHTAVRNAGHDCPASDQGYDLGRVDPLEVGAGFYGFELIFRCAHPLGALTLVNTALFARNPAHVDFARIELGRHFAQRVFTAGHERLNLEARAIPRSSGLGRYVRLGWRHISASALRLAFLLIALLLARRLADVGMLIAGLTAGYVLSFLAQASGALLPRLALVDGFIGALVALCAVCLAMQGMTRPRIVRVAWPALLAALAVIALVLRTPQAALLLVGFAAYSAGFLRLLSDRRPWGLALTASLYGFFDGWVLPSLLTPVHLAAATRAPMVIGYDVGALLAAAVIAALVVAAALVLAKVGFLEVVRSPVHEAAAACLAGLGTFWLLANAARTVPAASVAKSKPSIVQTLAHVDQTTVNPDSLLMRNYYLMGNTLIPMAEKPKE